MLLQSISFPTPEENIFYDDILLERAERGPGDGEVLRFWESSVYFIVLGRIGKPPDDCIPDAILSEHIPVVRRSTGGGTVVQGPGCLNYSLILAKSRASDMSKINQSYAYILNRVVAALAACGIDAGFFPVSDIALTMNQKKFSGNAQRRGRNFILHHGTILYDFDLSRVTRYLKMPLSMPGYRQQRTHADFLTNVTLDIPKFQKKLAESFGADENQSFISPSEMALLKEKIRSSDIHRMLPHA